MTTDRLARWMFDGSYRCYVPERQWIPITQERPPALWRVLFRLADGHCVCGCVTGSGYSLDWVWDYEDIGNEVTHWMPLPDGPGPKERAE